MQKKIAYRASILHFVADPADAGERAYGYFADGLLIVDHGKVAAVGDAAGLLQTLEQGSDVVDYRGKLILPGFVDTHVHYAQTDIIASHGEAVLEWLEKYTFPEERKFADAAHAAEVADFTLNEMLRNGTTSAMVFATVHAGSVDAIMQAAESRGMALIAGKVLMDRNCPNTLCDTADSGYHESKALIEKWHERGRLRYAVTPRFAPTSTESQLQFCGQLLGEHPSVYLQTHLAENKSECAWVQTLFPWSKNYLDVYARFGLVRERSVFAHCIYLADADRQQLASAGAAISFCPTSNLFLGSGLFDANATVNAQIRLGIGTDVGGGTSFSILRTLHEAYKVMHLTGHAMDAMQGFYHATLGGAKSITRDDEIGNFDVGKFADFVVLDPHATPLLARRTSCTESLAEQLFVLMMLGDEQAVDATYVAGQCLYRRGMSTPQRSPFGAPFQSKMA